MVARTGSLSGVQADAENHHLIEFPKEPAAVVGEDSCRLVVLCAHAGAATPRAKLEGIIILRQVAAAAVAAIGHAIDVVEFVGPVDATCDVRPDPGPSDCTASPPSPAAAESSDEKAVWHPVGFRRQADLVRGFLVGDDHLSLVTRLARNNGVCRPATGRFLV